MKTKPTQHPVGHWQVFTGGWWSQCDLQQPALPSGTQQGFEWAACDEIAVLLVEAFDSSASPYILIPAHSMACWALINWIKRKPQSV